MLGWIVSAFLLAGWFSTIVCLGFKLIQVKETVIRLCEEASIDSKKILGELGLNI